eukprot:14877316-Alexandrium_andersonii.AAC.1
MPGATVEAHTHSEGDCSWQGTPLRSGAAATGRARPARGNSRGACLARPVAGPSAVRGGCVRST